jgi:plastocyanin
MKSKWLLFIILIALVMGSGCADDQTEADDMTEGQAQTPAEEQGVSEAPVSAVASEEYGARLEYFGFVPEELEINRGDTVTWRNNNKQKVYTLISDDGLFDDQEMKYGNTFYHIFESSGTYTFSVADTPDMTMTVNVR